MRAQRHHERVRVRRRSVDGRRRLLLARRVGHRDDREPRLDRLVVGQLHVRAAERSARRSPPGPVLTRYACADAALGSAAPRPLPRRAPARSGPRDSCQRRAPGTPPISANPPASSPSTPTTSAMIVSSDTPPPPSELATSIVGAGVGRGLRSGPVDDRPVRVGLLDLERVRLGRRRLRQELKQRVLAGRRVAAGPGHLRDHGAVARAGLLHPACAIRAAAARTSRSRSPPARSSRSWSSSDRSSRSAPPGCRAAACPPPTRRTDAGVRRRDRRNDSPAPAASSATSAALSRSDLRFKVVLLGCVIRTAPWARRTARSAGRTATGPAVRQRREGR